MHDVAPVELFILGVGSIIGGSNRKQHDVASCGLLEGQSDGDASTFTGQVRFHTEDCVQTGGGNVKNIKYK